MDLVLQCQKEFAIILALTFVVQAEIATQFHNFLKEFNKINDDNVY